MTRQDVAELVVRMAVDNPRWGYTRIRGALSNLGHTIARTTVKRILHDHGVDPAPERSRHMPWKRHCQVADERAFFSLGAERPSLGQQAHVTSSH